jgi:CubicO group peptidase (beta-lactamase class C family)
MPDFRQAADLVRAAIGTRVSPGAAIEVGTATGPLWQETFGALSYEAGAQLVRPDTVYDLASLTKVISTASVAMRAVEHGTLALDDAVGAYLPDWRGDDRRDVTVRDVLSHTTGLPGYRPLYLSRADEASFRRAICAEPLDYAPRTASVYSDLGFMLLGFLLARERSLRDAFDTLWTTIGAGDDLQYLPPREWWHRTAPTEVDAWRGRLLQGEVHDENCHALGGVAAHAGLFGTAAAVGTFARHVLQVLEGRRGMCSETTLREFTSRRVDVPGSSRALAWDTMLPTSSCGSRMSRAAFGHTGFTGTSLWIDPDAGCYVVLLTNRVHPSRAGDGIVALRSAFHDAVMASL